MLRRLQGAPAASAHPGAPPDVTVSGVGSSATPGIAQHLDPSGWREHRFGQPLDRWKALNGRTFWVTGAGTGFGRSIAVALAAAGARVVLSGRRLKKLQETIAEMRSYGAEAESAYPVPADLTREADVVDAVAAIAERCGELDGAVHCAALPQGASGPWPLMSGTARAWERLMATNVTAAWLTGRAALSLMLQRDSARMVFLTSEAGWAFTPGHGPYNVSKCALNDLGASFAAECVARHPGADIQINVLDPGEARTEMNRGSATSPYTIVCMTLVLLSHPPGGPNGHFFHRDGRHLSFAYSAAYPRPLL